MMADVTARNRRADWLWPAGLFGVALVLRLAHLATLRHSPFFGRLWLDLAFFDDWGQKIAAGAWLGTGPFYQDPLYPYFLGVVYSILGHRPTAAIVIQLLLGSTVPLLVYVGVRRGWGKTEAIVAGAIAALYLPAIFYEGLVLKSWMDLFLVAAAVACLSRALGSASRPAWLGTGLLFGAACLARGNLILILPALAVWIVADPSAIPSGGSRRDRLASVGMLIAGAGLVLGACAVRNRVAGGEWFLTTAQAGQNFYLGNNPWNTRGECDPPPFLRTNPKHEESDFAKEAERRAGRTMGPAEISRFWFREGMAWIRENPGSWVALTWRKLRNFWGAYEIPDNIDLYVYRESAPILRLPLLGFGIVAPLALVGAVFGWKRRGLPRALLVFLVVYTAAVILFFVLSRYRLAAMPALFAFAGSGTVEIARRTRSALSDRSRVGPALWAAGLAVACFGLVNLPVRLPAGDPIYRFASQVGLPAVPASVSMEHFNLGVVYAREDDLPHAEEELRRALAEEPGRPQALVELGKVLAREGKTDEAISLLNRATDLEPLQPATYHMLGILYRRAGNAAAAEAAFRKALELDPRRGDSRRELDALRGAGP